VCYVIEVALQRGKKVAPLTKKQLEILQKASESAKSRISLSSVVHDRVGGSTVKVERTYVTKERGDELKKYFDEFKRRYSQG
jgi:hypothetical protein